MSSVLIAGTLIVNLALVFYTLGIVSEQRSHRITQRVLIFLSVGVVFDIIATGCMIAGSPRGPFTAHGLLGYSSLTAMLLETSFAWRHRMREGEATVPEWLHRYSRLAYSWWVIAYITGALLVMARRV
jgi:uncharacterized repeat protein (TIGR03987 family)